jgi:hypothetical protein
MTMRARRHRLNWQVVSSPVARSGDTINHDPAGRSFRNCTRIVRICQTAKWRAFACAGVKNDRAKHSDSVESRRRTRWPLGSVPRGYSAAPSNAPASVASSLRATAVICSSPNCPERCRWLIILKDAVPSIVLVKHNADRRIQRGRELVVSPASTAWVRAAAGDRA